MPLASEASGGSIVVSNTNAGLHVARRLLANLRPAGDNATRMRKPATPEAPGHEHEARTQLRSWFAASLAIVVLAGCGGDDDPGALDTLAGSGQAATTETNGGGGATTLTNTNENVVCENTSCEGFAFQRGDGSVFLCSRLEISPVEVAVVPAAGTTTETETETETETGDTTTETETGETTTETETMTVSRPNCAAGAFEIPVEGLEFEELPNVHTSEDGQATWTGIVVRVQGKIVDGTLVADE